MGILSLSEAWRSMPGRKSFLQHLNRAISGSRENKRRFAVMVVDLDGFNEINYAKGCDYGDKLLLEIGKRLKLIIGEKGYVARSWGDEFLIACHLKKEKEALNKAEELIKGFDEGFKIGGERIYVTASVGIALFPNHGENSENLISTASMAMKRAKENGRKRYVFDDIKTRNDTCRVIEITNCLKEMTEEDKYEELELLYQPQFHLATGKSVGAEALLRWNSPKFGLLMPNLFISIAEERGLIVKLGEWILMKACKQAKYWIDSGASFQKMAVNISKQQLSTSFSGLVRDTLKRTGLEPHYLELEITETLAMTDSERTKLVLNELRGLGVRIALDDFGSGYSSLSYLSSIPIDCIKIDAALIKDLPGNQKNSIITESIIELAHSLDYGVIAEGVETREQLSFLKEKKCDYFQGFLFSKPLPKKDYERKFL